MPARKKRSSKKTGATRNTEAKSSGLSWAIMGLLVGAFVGFLVYLDKIPTGNGNADAQSESIKKHQTASKPQEKDNKVHPKEHQFDFYTVLPDRNVEVTVHEETSEQPTRAEQKLPEAKPVVSSAMTESNALYQLQVGAFKALEKADAMKARLAFMGVESNIQVVQSNGQKIYRVRVGPNSDAHKIEQIKAQLKAQNINTFMQKL